MVNVPPLLCSTPPPIDFGEEDDDSGSQPTLNLDETDDEFSNYGLVTETRRLDIIANDTVNGPHLMPDSKISQTDFTIRPPDPDNCFVSCTTPPPLATITTDIKPKNLKPLSPPPLVEAFNFDVTHNFPLDAREPQDFVSIQQQLVNEITQSSNVIKSRGNGDGDLDVGDVDVDDEEEATNNDNVPSLKLDSLSLYSSGSVSSATLSPAIPLDELEENTQVVQPETQTKLCGGLVHQVTLEDVSDDSCDDDYSPKKRKSLIVNDEESEDFFAIHIVNDEKPKTGKIDIKHNHHKEEENVDVNYDEDDEMQLKVEIINPSTDCYHAFEKMHEKVDEVNSNDFDGFAVFQTNEFETEAISPPSLSSSKSSEAAVVSNTNYELDDDFGDFADFSLANTTEQTTAAVVNQIGPEANHLEEKSVNVIPQQAISDINKDDHHGDGVGNDDDFDDFQDFATATNDVPTPSGQTINTKSETNNNNINDFVADDDDFGDFSEASFSSASAAPLPSLPMPSETKPNIKKTVVPPPPPPAATNISITERVKPVLEMMFPTIMINDPTSTINSETPSTIVPHIKDNMQFSAIEQAKALNYQWTNSEMRFALIRSLGIDSRNILFSEKWNSNMPRFAANLSFDPIKPMKPQSPAAGRSSVMNTITSSSSKVGSNMSGGSTTLNPTQTIMSAEDFDWKNGSVHKSMSGTDTLQSTDGAEIETKSSEFYERQQEQQQQEEEFIATNDDDEIVVQVDNIAIESKDDDYDNDNVDDDNDDSDYSNRYEPPNVDTTTKTSTNVMATTATTLSSTLSADSNGHGIDNFEQHSVQQNLDLNEDSTSIALKNNNYEMSGAIATATSLDMIKSKGFIDSCNNNNNILCHEQYHLGCDLPSMTMTTTTYNVPLKETHIFTPSKSDTAIAKTTTTTTTPTTIDFDYEIASAGIIIDETVVKKEYRDIEYKPPYDLEMIKPTSTTGVGVGEVSNIYLDPPKIKAETLTKEEGNGDDNDLDDDFSDFQSVPVQNHQQQKIANNSTFGDQMILSPAILLPQAISIESNKTKKPSIEWGDSANTNINPDELARIEELFPQPKTSMVVKSKETSKPGTPVHYQQQSQQQQQECRLPQAPTISAAVAQNHTESGTGDDDWSDFVSVPIINSNGGSLAAKKQQQQTNLNNNNNNGNTKTAKLMQGGNKVMMNSPQRYNISATKGSKLTNSGSVAAGGGAFAGSSGDVDEWSDFVSSAPPISVPQFNSAAWQRANFYNNPMSLHQQNQHYAHSNLVPNSLVTTKYEQKNHLNNNNYDNKLSNNNNSNNNRSKQQQQKLQQIHIMHDFSTAPTAETSHQQQIYQQQHYHYTQQLQQQQQQQRNNHHQQQHQSSTSASGIGAKVAPRISLIPDLSFMTPALQTNAGAFMSSLPKPSFSTKK